MRKVNGRFLWQALAYARVPCPDSEKTPRLAHVVFVDHRIIGSDGVRMHIGVLPVECAIKKPMAIARTSVDELLLGLQYAWRISKRHNTEFSVKIEGDVALIDYGEHVIPHKLLRSDVGEIPATWDNEPVPLNAPLLRENQAEIDCGHMRDAMSWFRAWNKDHGTFTMRGAGGNNPIRIDIVDNGEHVVTAQILPLGRPPMQLPEDGDLFTQGKSPTGQSLLDLRLVDRMPGDAAAPVGGEDAPAAREGRDKKKGRRKGADAPQEDAGDAE